ncbi:aminotransferase class III-fold pyridoxal phosphate-dependent enzyme, partial [Lentimicrobium sp. L6]
FQSLFKEIHEPYQSLRKSVVHSDANDNNVIVSNDLIHPQVKAIIDYGDAIYTQTINDLAIAIAYAVMNKSDVLEASLPIIKAYYQEFPLLEEELEFLYTLVAMRLVISVTKSAINRQLEPDNTYLLISEKPAWQVLEKWKAISEDLAHYSFRAACGFCPHPKEKEFKNWAAKQNISIQSLFPQIEFEELKKVDMSIESTWMGHESEYLNNQFTEYKLQELKSANKNIIVAGGYLETRPFYITDAYKKESNNGPIYRAVHLGTDLWLEAKTAIHAPLDGEVFSIHHNDADKDYGPTLILKHQTEEGLEFYSLYGHLSLNSLNQIKKNQKVKRGELIAWVGNQEENGNWAAHLHFQLMLSMLDYEYDFPGVSTAKELEIWSSICPDSNLLWKEKNLEEALQKDNEQLIKYRKQHLGKSLSLSYDIPLKMVRGAGAFLLDSSGRKYLDTVNNVAHVGHEHERVVKAGQAQMGILNTNSRYLHENINQFAEELLSTFPQELSVVHFVNSGSEANELALRMCRAYSGQKDMIAVEIGYHGNTNGCIEVSSYKFDGKGGKGAPEHTHIVPLPDAYRGLYQGENCGEKYAAHIQEQVDRIQAKGRNVAGFICESIISCGGQIELPEDYLKTAYSAIRKAGGLCISDEVQVGVGRVGKAFWGFQLHDVVPDIVTIGKPIGNGHPLAAVVCTRAVADAFANGMEYFNTFGGNPVSCAIGREVLRVVKDEKLQQNALEVGEYLKSELEVLSKDFPIIGNVRGQGLFLGFELVDENKNPLPEKAAYLANRMKDLGILMSTDGKDVNVLKIKPPMVFSKENAEELIKRLKVIFTEDFMRE